MKTQDFILPRSLRDSRKIILKGVVYECQGTLVMAQETTCSLTKKTFKGVCVGRNDDWKSDSISIVGSKGKWMIINFEESK